MRLEALGARGYPFLSFQGTFPGATARAEEKSQAREAYCVPGRVYREDLPAGLDDQSTVWCCFVLVLCWAGTGPDSAGVVAKV